MNKLHWTTDFLIDQGVQPEYVQTIAVGIDIILLVLTSLIADFIARRILLSIIHRVVKRSKATWDDYFFEQKVFKNLAHLVPAWIVHTSLPYIFSEGDPIANLYQVIHVNLKVGQKALDAVLKDKNENGSSPGKRT